jgi:LacI family gluconate utilization system Gnt-I transcriptional repressor
MHSTSHTQITKRLLRRSDIPIVEVGNLTSSPIDAMVSYSNFKAAKAMTEHLISRGYKRIGLVSIPLAGTERAQERRRGFVDAMAEAGLAVADSQMLETPGSFENGSRAIALLLERRPDLDAVFLAGDVLAIGATFECRRRGWSIPDRVAIAGFDTWEMAEMLDSPVTALDIPRADIGRIAGELILRRLNGAPARSIPPIDVGFRVIHRQTT